VKIRQGDQLFDLLKENPVAIASIHAICTQQSKQIDAIDSVVVGVAIHLCTRK
jgi:hypothetical protein